MSEGNRFSSLRTWQQEALHQYLEHLEKGRRQLLWEATPGAGKTTAALKLCRHQLKHASSKLLIIVVPTAHLKLQWAHAAKRQQLDLDSSFRSNASRVSRDYHGIVVTYQQVANHPLRFAKLASQATVILDEVHHAGDGLSWGQGLLAAFQEAPFVLALSGTPFRSDSSAIPFVRYEHGVSEPDYVYSHGQAVADGVCRPVAFLTYGGSVSWQADNQILCSDFGDQLDREGAANRLRAALDTDSGWIDRLLKDAHSMLHEIRTKDSTAGGLVVCRDREHARKIARVLSRIAECKPVVVLSDDRRASKKIAEFRDSHLPWIIACNMVSEGVDIPRLRVGVFATVIQTRMYFRQFLGRIVRRTPGTTTEELAYCYLPADPNLSGFAEDIDSEQRHALNLVEREDEEDVRSRTDREPPERIFSALGGNNTGIDRMILNGNQLAFWEGGGTDSSNFFEEHEEQAPMNQEAGLSTKVERKEQLGREIQRLVSLYRRRTGAEHSQIHHQLNRKQSVKSQRECTEIQLLQRIRLLHRQLEKSDTVQPR